MFKKTLLAVAAASMAGMIGTSFAQTTIQKTTVIHPITADSKVVVKKKTVVRHPGAAVVVHKKKVVHYPMTNTKVVHKSTVIHSATGAKTVVVHPAVVKTDRTL